MKQKYRRPCRWALSLVMVFMLAAALLMPATSVQAEADIAIIINGQKFQSEVAPQVRQDRVLLPMRLIFEALGAGVSWEPATRTVTATKGLDVITLAIGSSAAIVNDKHVVLDTPAIIEQDRTMVPVRFVAESLGSDVQWDNATRTVSISTIPGSTPAPSAPADTYTPATATDTTGKYISGDRVGQDMDFTYKQGKNVRLQAGSTLVFYKSGFLSEGILAADTELEYGPEKAAVFKAGTKIVFNSKGYVAKGELAQPFTLEYAPGQSLEFKAAPVEFSKDAYLAIGTPAADCELKFGDRVRTLFQGGQETEFFPNGNVKRATPKRDISLPFNDDKLTAATILDNTDGKSAVFKAGTEVSFYQNGKVEKGILYQNTSLPYRFNQYLIFKGDTAVEFGTNGYISIGTLRDHQYLPYNDEEFLDIEAGSRVAFSGGNIKIAVLQYDTELEYRNGEKLNFLQGTEVEFNSQGYVMRGTLESGSKIHYDPNWTILVMGGREVEFNRDGYISSAYLADYFQQEYATYKEHSRVEFDDKGKIIYGTLRDSSGLPLGNGQRVQCAAGTEVFLHPNYKLKEATLQQQEKLAFGPDLTNIRQVRLQGSSKVYFTDRGYVSQGVLFENTMLEYADKKAASFKGGTEVEFYSSGYVKSGIIASETRFENAIGEKYTVAPNMKVNFSASGLLESVQY